MQGENANNVVPGGPIPCPEPSKPVPPPPKGQRGVMKFFFFFLENGPSSGSGPFRTRRKRSNGKKIVFLTLSMLVFS